MTTFEFIDGPPPTRKQPPVLHEFARALRARPMQWAIWPKKVTVSTASTYASSIRLGFHNNFGRGFEAVARQDVLYVRYVGEGER